MEVRQRAGINLKMKTGDYVFTAKAIATKCGILQPHQETKGVVVEGKEFHEYMLEERLQKVEKICVMAR